MVVLVGVLFIAVVARFAVFPFVAVGKSKWARIALAVTLATAVVIAGFLILVYGGFFVIERLSRKTS